MLFEFSRFAAKFAAKFAVNKSRRDPVTLACHKFYSTNSANVRIRRAVSIVVGSIEFLGHVLSKTNQAVAGSKSGALT